MSGHILTIIKSKCLYTCFVDFQKAYDSIQRDELKNKLEKIDINRRFLDIINAIFKASNVSLLYKNKVKEPFYKTIGT